MWPHGALVAGPAFYGGGGGCCLVSLFPPYPLQLYLHRSCLYYPFPWTLGFVRPVVCGLPGLGHYMDPTPVVG